MPDTPGGPTTTGGSTPPRPNPPQRPGRNDGADAVAALLRSLEERSGLSGGADGLRRRWLPIMAIFAVLFVLGSSIYQVEAEEVGVVTRFQKVARVVAPGLNVKLPLIERVIRVPVERQLKEEFGFRTVEDGRSERFVRVGDEALMLTGDLNVANVEWTVQYRVIDPFAYLFNVRNNRETLRASSESLMREVVGDRTVSEVLTIGRQDIETRVQDDLNDLVRRYEMGISIVQVVLQDVTPPDAVRASWDEVNQAQQQRDRMINDARAAFNRDVPRAAGEAQEEVLRAQAYSVDRINRSLGEVSRFLALHDEYRRSPEVTRNRLYLEAMEQILGNVEGKVFVDSSLEGLIPLLQIGGAGGAATLTPVPVPTAAGGRP